MVITDRLIVNTCAEPILAIGQLEIREFGNLGIREFGTVELWASAGTRNSKAWRKTVRAAGL